MTISLSVAKSAPSSIAAIGIPVASDGAVPSSVGVSRDSLKSVGFEGKNAQTYVMPASGKTGPVRILVGVGATADVTDASLRLAAAALARAAAKYESLATTLATVGRVEKKSAAQAVVEGVLLVSHRYVALKNDKSGAPKLNSLVLVSNDQSMTATKAGAARGEVIANAICMARDLANTPPAHLTARMMAEKAVEVARANGLDVTVYDKDQLKAMGCGGIIGVNKGSTEPPRMVKLEYKPSNPQGNVVLVGKGVMYDSGGISLKPSDAFHIIMKMDMSGAAAVLATISTLKALRCRTAVTAYLMCTDNMPSGSALKLGDVLTMRNGKTVEIHNTDAEGRLILADGLSLAAEQKPDAIVDIATLTGACLTALGERVAGLLSNNDAWAAQVKAASERVDEPVWQLPLYAPYKSLLDSNVADMRNIGGPYGGTITASLFLEEFVNGVPWAHLDIAGPMNSNGDDGWMNKGATAFGARLMINLVTNFEKPSKSGKSGKKKAASKAATAKKPATKSATKPAKKVAKKK